MSTKRNALAAAMLIAIGVITLGTLSASAATPACGAACLSIFSVEHGIHGQPNVVEAVLDGVAEVGQPVILKPASNSDPSQDLVARPSDRIALVSDFYATGLVSAEVNSHYGDQVAAEIEYAPFGLGTGLCVGLAMTAFQGQGLTLQPCSVSARTVWIVCAECSPLTAPARYFPIVSASTTDFSRPFAMHYPRDQQATDRRTQQILVRRLQFLTEERALPDRQLWGLHFGVLP